MVVPKKIYGIPTIPALFTIIIIISYLMFTGIIQIPNLAVVSGQVLSLSKVSLTTGGTGGWASGEIWKAQVLLGTGGDKISNQISSPTNQLTYFETKSMKPLTVTYELTQEQFTYPLTLASPQPSGYAKVQGDNFDLKSAYDYGFPIISGGTHYLSPTCANDLFGILGATQQTKQVQGDIGIKIPNSCLPEYQEICKHSGGTPIISTTSTNFFNLASIPSTGYKCLKIIPDTSKPVINLFRPTNKQAYASANVILSNGIGQEIVSINTDNKQIAYSNDNKVRVAMTYGVNSFLPDAPEYSSFYLLVTPGFTVPITTSVFSNIPTQYPQITQGESESDVLTAVNSYNDKFNNIIINKQTGFTSSEEINKAVYSSSNKQLVLDRTNLPSIFPVLDLEIVADYLGILRPVAIPHITVSPQVVQLTEGGSGATITASITKDGEGAIYVSSPVCNPNGIISTPSTTVSKTDSSWTQVYLLNGAKGTYSCTITAYNADQSKSDSASFSVNIAQICTKKPINNQVLDTDTCTISCPLNCGATESADYINCKCIPPSGTTPTPQPTACTNPDVSLQFEGALWNTNTCKWECPSGQSAILGDDNKVKCGVIQQKQFDLTKFLSDNALYIAGGLVILGGGYYIFGMKGGRKR